MRFSPRILFGLATLALFALLRPPMPAATAPQPQCAGPVWKFWLAPGAAPSGWTKVSTEADYDDALGYGYESTSDTEYDDIGTKADTPFSFSAGLAEGNYRVAVTFSGTLTVQSELRRLSLENAASAPGKTVRREFIVNIRRPAIAGATEEEKNAVDLKPRELEDEAWAWDNKLTLTFSAPEPAEPCITAVEIARADDVPTLFILGDSTVCDQPKEPYASWGQMLPRFFKPDIAVANHAESGESYQSALDRGRLDKVVSQLRPGDTVMMQFGHNDMKVVDVATYKASIQHFVAAIRAKKADVVLVTQVQRRTFDAAGKIINSHKGYPDAVRDVAREEHLPLIDLHAMSAQFYEALGKQGSGAAFKTGDGTHHNSYGAYELAKCIIEGIRENVPDLAGHIADDIGRFDPAKPDAPESLKISTNPAAAPGEKPEGS